MIEKFKINKSISAFFLVLTNLWAQNNNIYSIYNFNPIVITGSHIPTEFANSPRNITVLDGATIEQQNAESIEDLLQKLTDIQIETRGPLGVQSDFSIRGASGEQTLVLIDGMKISDSQTAHHSMNIPVTMNDIAQIEILRGNASKIYGPNALGGVINIITKKSERSNGNVTLSGGKFDYFEGNFSGTVSIKNLSQRLSVSQKSCDGYRENTDFDITHIFYKSGLQTAIAKFDLSFGYQHKDFGANSFYSSRFPLQYENTETYLANFSTFIPQNWGHLSFKISGRRHNDHFLLDKSNPSFYKNKHRTNSCSAELNGLYQHEKFQYNFGSDIGFDEIISNSLGTHKRARLGFFSEALYPFDKWNISPGISGYYYKNWGFQVFPGIDLGYQWNSSMRLFGSIGRSFRIPSFTDLYYKSPANLGNENLQPEKAVSAELGMKYHLRSLESSLTLFCRNTKDLIEFTRKNADDPWQATNISEMKTKGVEASFHYQPKTRLLQSLQIHYAYTSNVVSNCRFEGKYLTNSLRQNGSLNLSHTLPYDILATWNFVYQEIRFDNQNVLTVNFNANIPWKNLYIYLNVTNLLNAKYAFFERIPMPGRWLKLGLKYHF
ncbi:MAG: TonB-dependent receptor [Candidatus Marinimicrobia bacterium]|nr:TonB-dependent receptor [Candidatus Neomarinimicrobiota bacterium]